MGLPKGLVRRLRSFCGAEIGKCAPPREIDLVPLANDGGGNRYCLHAAACGARECPVVFWDHALGEGQDPACVGRNLEAWLSVELGESKTKRKRPANGYLRVFFGQVQPEVRCDDPVENPIGKDARGADQEGRVAADGVARARSPGGGGLGDGGSGLVCRRAIPNVRRRLGEDSFDESTVPLLLFRVHPRGEIGGGGGAAVGHLTLHGAGLDDDLHPVRGEFAAERVAGRLESELRTCIGTVRGHRDLSADRADVHDPAVTLMGERQQCLSDGDVPEQVDVE